MNWSAGLWLVRVKGVPTCGLRVRWCVEKRVRLCCFCCCGLQRFSAFYTRPPHLIGSYLQSIHSIGQRARGHPRDLSLSLSRSASEQNPDEDEESLLFTDSFRLGVGPESPSEGPRGSDLLLGPSDPTLSPDTITLFHWLVRKFNHQINVKAASVWTEKEIILFKLLNKIKGGWRTMSGFQEKIDLMKQL